MQASKVGEGCGVRGWQLGGGWWLVVGGWWLVVGGWWLAAGWLGGVWAGPG